MLLLVNKVYFSPLSAALSVWVWGKEGTDRSLELSYLASWDLSTFHFWSLFLTNTMGCFLCQGFVLSILNFYLA